jgi:glycosyltransferase involved in cell wall biosynthesis
MLKTVSIVIPVYFNAESLPILFRELCEVERELLLIDIALELIFVDDGSGDSSFEELLLIKDSRPSTKIVKLTRNFGAVHAFKCGLGFVTGDCFMVFAADLQNPPKMIPQMIEKWSLGSKYTICVRTSRDDPLMSRIYSAFFYKLLKLIGIKNYPDGGYDMALMDKDLLPHLIVSSKNSYTHLLIHWLGFKPEIIYYHRPMRIHGKSRWTFAKKFKVFLDVMLGFSVTPIRAISSIGAIVSLLSFSYGITVVVLALIEGNSVAGFPTIVALLTFLLGLIILMLGIIGEYLWRIFDESNLRPETVIEKVY